MGWCQSLRENCANVGEGDHEHHGFEWAGIEAEGEVEALRVFRDGVDDDAANADGVCGVGNAAGGVAEEGSADAAGLPVPVDGEAGEYDDWDGAGHVAAEAAGSGVDGDCARGEGIIGDDTGALAENKGSRGAAGLVGAGAAFEPVIERRLAGNERGDVVVIGERFGRRERAYFSHGAGVLRERRRRGLGRGGASRRRRNSA